MITRNFDFTLPTYETDLYEIADLIEDYRHDPAKIAEADKWIAGTMPGEHYSAMERALADLHEVHPEDLLGSEVLRRLWGLAKVQAAAREEQFRIMAEDELRSMEERSSDHC